MNSTTDAIIPLHLHNSNSKIHQMLKSSYKIFNFRRTSSFLLFILVLLLLSCNGNKQKQANTASLYVDIKNPNKGKIILKEILPGEIVLLDSTDISSFGNYNFRLLVDDEALFMLSFPDGIHIPLCVKKSENIVLELDLKNPQHYQVKGSPGSSLLALFNRRTQLVSDKLKEIGTSYEEMKTQSNFKIKRDSLIQAYEEVFHNHKIYADSLIRANSSSIAALLMINKRLGPEQIFLLKEDTPLFSYIDSCLLSTIPENRHVLHHHTRLSDFKKKQAEEQLAIERLSPGKPAPNITMPDTSGKMHSLSSYKGQKVLLCFWASWCNACVRDFPKLKTIHSEFSDIEIIGVSIDRQKVLWKKAIEKTHLPWLNISDLKAPNTPVLKAYNLKEELPVYYIIDKQGDIIGHTTQVEDIATLLRQ